MFFSKYWKYILIWTPDPHYKVCWYWPLVLFIITVRIYSNKFFALSSHFCVFCQTYTILAPTQIKNILLVQFFFWCPLQLMFPTPLLRAPSNHCTSFSIKGKVFSSLDFLRCGSLQEVYSDDWLCGIVFSFI